MIKLPRPPQAWGTRKCPSSFPNWVSVVIVTTGPKGRKCLRLMLYPNLSRNWGNVLFRESSQNWYRPFFLGSGWGSLLPGPTTRPHQGWTGGHFQISLWLWVLLIHASWSDFFVAGARCQLLVAKIAPTLWFNALLKHQNSVLGNVKDNMSFNSFMELWNASLSDSPDLFPRSTLGKMGGKSSCVHLDEAIFKAVSLEKPAKAKLKNLHFSQQSWHAQSAKRPSPRSSQLASGSDAYTDSSLSSCKASSFSSKCRKGKRFWSFLYFFSAASERCSQVATQFLAFLWHRELDSRASPHQIPYSIPPPITCDLGNSGGSAQDGGKVSLGSGRPSRSGVLQPPVSCLGGDRWLASGDWQVGPEQVLDRDSFVGRGVNSWYIFRWAPGVRILIKYL